MPIPATLQDFTDDYLRDPQWGALAYIIDQAPVARRLESYLEKEHGGRLSFDAPRLVRQFGPWSTSERMVAIVAVDLWHPGLLAVQEPPVPPYGVGEMAGILDEDNLRPLITGVMIARGDLTVYRGAFSRLYLRTKAGENLVDPEQPA